VWLLAMGVLVSATPAFADHDISIPFEDIYEVPDDVEDPEAEPPGAWADFIDARDDDNRTEAIQGFRGDGVKVTIPTYTNRGTGGILRLDPSYDEAWFRYYLRLDRWNASSSGKLPGLAGLYSSSARGCIPSTEASPGWSARTMFEATGSEGAGAGQVRLGTYLYHLGQEGTCGDQILWQPGVLQQGRWYCVEGRVRMNTPGQADGRVDAWVDGGVSLQWPDVAFRRVGEDDIEARHFWANVYFGGSVVNSSDLTASLDQMVFSHTGRVGCLDTFTDDNSSEHEADLEELYARSIFLGCGDRLSCAAESITRAEMAALLQRSLGLPSGPDAFDDDDGFAEASINALSAAKIALGCTPTRFCPDDPVTRGQMAAFLTRAFKYRDGAGADLFSDDDQSVFQTDIDRLATAGVTKGCNPPTNDAYCPEAAVTRGQMATFLRRALGFELGRSNVGYAADVRVGEMVPNRFEGDASEPLPQIEETLG
jgi:hypothetical protein